jgi:hypothetical protein
MKITKNALKRIIRETINEVGGPWGPEIPRKQGCPPCPPCDERQIDPFKDLPAGLEASLAPQRGHDASLADVKPRMALEEEMPTRDLEESKVTKSTLKRMVRQALARKHRKS